ncbi:coiled-coil domain-containing protein 27 isoform X1 [Xenopus laevis]|uniref:Coiled-coil domain-containing protein 27 isoform X1 n=4 Tax=Xenopus laevis TaxID=8355 RepID=A0A8J1LCZ4_XENLA|nr:coiled-coil domain-containing protein 27 isoform X1 [Xenopus laevis]
MWKQETEVQGQEVKESDMTDANPSGQLFLFSSEHPMTIFRLYSKADGRLPMFTYRREKEKDKEWIRERDKYRAVTKAGLKMQSFQDLNWSGRRRPQTAVWKIPKSDRRKEKYSRSAGENGQFIQNEMSSRSSSDSFKFNDFPAFTPTDGRHPGTHSPRDINKSNKSLEVSSVAVHNHNGIPRGPTYLTSVELKTPWYIEMLHEKENNLLKLGSEINRLSAYEVECKRKEEIISILKNEVQQLQNELSHTNPPQDPMAKRYEVRQQHNEVKFLNGHNTTITQEYSIGAEDPDELVPSASSPMENSHSTSLSVCTKDTQQTAMQLTQVDTESLDEKSSEQEHNLESEVGQLVHDCGEEYSSSEDNQELLNRLKEELDSVKNSYEMAKGANMSLQKLLSHQESQLRKALDEKQILQKEAKERNMQLQAMSLKFSSLREERKHEEMMAAISKENYNLRELVTELKSEMSKRNDMITDLKREVQRLQRQCTDFQIQLKKNEEDKNDIQRNSEDLLCSNQQIKVTLECLQSRFERFRTKIIQATYSAPGVKCPHLEMTDNEILEGMQRIITERSDFHQQLKQKGVKVPSLYINENTASKQPASNTRKKL